MSCDQHVPMTGLTVYEPCPRHGRVYETTTGYWLCGARLHCIGMSICIVPATTWIDYRLHNTTACRVPG